LLTLLEIIAKYDLGDEIGRDKLKILLSKIVRDIEVEDESIKIIVKIFEELFPQTEARLEVSVVVLSVFFLILQITI
jgi:hypothetical protein